MHTSQGKEPTTKLKVHKSLKRLVKTMDDYIKVVTPADPDITTINQLQYTGAKLISSKLAPKKQTGNKKSGKSRVPPWKQRL